MGSVQPLWLDIILQVWTTLSLCVGVGGNYHAGAGFMKLLHLTNLYFVTSVGDKMHSLVRRSSLVRRKGFMKHAPDFDTPHVGLAPAHFVCQLIFSRSTHHNKI